jgi:hypothetical protein
MAFVLPPPTKRKHNMFLVKLRKRNNVRVVKMAIITHLKGSASGSSQLVSTSASQEVLLSFANVREQNDFITHGNAEWEVFTIVAQSEQWVTRNVVYTTDGRGWWGTAEVWSKAEPSNKVVVKTGVYNSFDTCAKMFWHHWNHDPKWPKGPNNSSLRLIRLNPDIEWEDVK